MSSNKKKKAESVGQIIYRPKVNNHQCKPFMEQGWIKSPVPNRSVEPYDVVPPLGTIWRCDCGVLWRVAKQPYANVFPRRKWTKAGLWTRLRVWWRFL